MFSIYKKYSIHRNTRCLNLYSYKYYKIICKSTKNHPGISYSEHNYCRSNVMADFIDKFTNDINMVNLSENDDPEYDSKSIAMLHCIIIICVLIYMFWDTNKND